MQSPRADDSFGVEDARTACRMMGLPTANPIPCESYFSLSPRALAVQ